MTQTIILIHIGPVQDFIKSARRCRELWYGSRLLSQVSHEVARVIEEQTSSAALIFPGRIRTAHDQGAPADVSVANKIQAVIEGADPAQIKTLVEDARMRMSRFLRDEASREFDFIIAEMARLRLPTQDFRADIARSHIESMMEFFWVAVSFEVGDYKRARQRAESLLAARKNTRDWDATPLVSYGIPKSSIDGVRESVIHERVYDPRQRHPHYQSWMLPALFGVHGEERLCGVGLLKRRGSPPGEEDAEAPPFHSTSHMASGPMRCRMAACSEAAQVWDDLLDELLSVLGRDLRAVRARMPQGQQTYSATDPRRPERLTIEAPHALPTPESSTWGYDGIVLYPNRVDTSGPGSLLATLAQDDQARARHAQQLQAKQRALLRALKLSEPFGYYALLLADGDRMGKAIDEIGTPEEHKRLSEQLDAGFASQCAQIVQAHGGSLIYSGGDDVLALLPLHTALTCAVKLNARFDEVMQVIFGEQSARPTLSVGLTVAHYLEPFGEVRQQAKEAEQLAKDAGRARLAVSVRKRGNATLSVVGPWRIDDALADPQKAQVICKPSKAPNTTQAGDEVSAAPSALHERLPMWGRILSERGVPRGLAYKLEEAIAPLLVELRQEPSDQESLEALCSALVRGVLQRRDIPDDRLQDDLVQLFNSALVEQRQLRTADGLPAPLRAIRAMAHELRIASTFNEAWQIAFDSPTDDEQGDRV